MRRLMVKLVAVETALVGWLAYWIFLVYSGNPEISGGLASQLSKFPSLSFTTVDITVLVVISALSILLAFKFDRGLKPGIRLERAIQMLESLMKRNLMLEAQVAEMKMASVQSTMSEPESNKEPPLGSWERAFRTPIEAGPSIGSQIIRRGGRSSSPSTPDDHPDSFPTQRSHAARIDPKPSQTVNIAPSPRFSAESVIEKDSGYDEKVVTSSQNESSTDQFSQLKGASPQSRRNQPDIAPSVAPRKSNIAIAQPNSRRQPYIPIPASKTVLPSSLPRPSVSPTSQSRPIAHSTQTSETIEGSQSTEQSSSSETTPFEATTQHPSSANSSSTEVTRRSPSENHEANEGETISDDDGQAGSRMKNKSSGLQKKRFPWEDA
jgi:hypothetical protein